MRLNRRSPAARGPAQRNGTPLLAAGRWESWQGEGSPLRSFTVLTQPNAAIPPPLVPDGPVFLAHDRRRHWLDASDEEEEDD